MKYFHLLEYHGMIQIPVKLRHFAGFVRCLFDKHAQDKYFRGGGGGERHCLMRGSQLAVVIRPKFSDQLSWKWRQQTSKSAIFLASLADLPLWV